VEKVTNKLRKLIAVLVPVVVLALTAAPWIRFH
jgi:hypothetical protein